MIDKKIQAEEAEDVRRFQRRRDIHDQIASEFRQQTILNRNVRGFTLFVHLFFLITPVDMFCFRRFCRKRCVSVFDTQSTCIPFPPVRLPLSPIWRLPRSGTLQSLYPPISKAPPSQSLPHSILILALRTFLR
jgi:hypothetical protein